MKNRHGFDTSTLREGDNIVYQIGKHSNPKFGTVQNKHPTAVILTDGGRIALTYVLGTYVDYKRPGEPCDPEVVMGASREEAVDIRRLDDAEKIAYQLDILEAYLTGVPLERKSPNCHTYLPVEKSGHNFNFYYHYRRVERKHTYNRIFMNRNGMPVGGYALDQFRRPMYNERGFHKLMEISRLMHRVYYDYNLDGTMAAA